MKKFIYLLSLALTLPLASCSDFFETDSDHVIYADEDHLSNANDTIYSMIGILNKLQAIADRTILLGEARGDLVDVTDNTPADLRNVALFNIDDDNAYNNPRDYYAVINNCNYFLANADVSLKNNRNEYLFLKEYAAVKGIRAWTYLQLVLNYGEVPFVTEPVLTKADAEKDYPKKDIKGICDYFLYEDNLQEYVDVDYPGYGSIKGIPSKMFYFPLYIVLGDLNLWAGNYYDAARCYYNYINTRNGVNSTYPTGTVALDWMSSTWSAVNMGSCTTYRADFSNETNSSNSEIITLIPGDSIPSEGYYSELGSIFNTTYDGTIGEVSLTASQGLQNLSENQTFCYYDGDGYLTVPKGLSNYRSGDLRLYGSWSYTENGLTVVAGNRTSYDNQVVYKYRTKNIHIYRRQLIYLRLAEALNCAGYPRFAYQILSSGVNNQIIEHNVLPYYTADSLKLAQFDFPNTRYILQNPESNSTLGNTQGIHSRGCGYSPMNTNYQMPVDTTITDSLAQIAWQQEQVENMIIDEEALEMAFEGYRFYDLMRVALRRNDPSFLAKRVYARRGEGVDSGISVDLNDKKNWYLKWNGEFGLGD